MSKLIGELLLPGGVPVLKMWRVDIGPKQRPFVRHCHTPFEIMTVCSGSGQYKTENAVYPILPGDVFVFSSNEIHSITESGPEGLSIINLHVEPRYLKETGAALPEESLMVLCFSHAPAFQNRIPAAQAAVLRDHFSGITGEFSDREKRFPTAIQARLSLFLIELLRHHSYESAVPSKNHSHFRAMLTVYAYIDEHLNDDLSLKELAGLVNLSPNYFSSIFKQMNSLSLWDYITSKRIEKAMRLICSPSSERSISDIALSCGFNNTVNFNKAFKRLTGITPRELKKNPEILL